jgi:hypothetical protein
VTNSSWITLFQWLSLSGSILALVSFIGLWIFTDRLQQEKDVEIHKLENVTEALRGFSDVAQLDAAGLPFREGGSIRYDSPLSTALRDLYIATGRRQAVQLQVSLALTLFVAAALTAESPILIPRTQSAFHPHEQQGAFPRRDVHSQSRSPVGINR